ncbi:MAG: FecR family protein [Pedobacter sp.]|jgi:hypothetical protein
MSQRKLEELLRLFVEGKISRSEYEQLFDYIRSSSDEDDGLNHAVDHIFRNIKNYGDLSAEEKELLYKNISSLIDAEEDCDNEKPGRNIWYQIGVAASVVIVLAIGLFFYSNKSQDQPALLVNKVLKPIVIKPGGSKAVLTLSDGSKIILDNAKNGILANQAGVSIQKTSDGELLYSFSNADESVAEKITKDIIYNKIETPLGGKYQINLPDGSKVWLNSASSLRFPALFSGNTREVELDGEAFFNVAKNKNKPFKVITKDQIVEVLGTQFNINSYGDEEVIKTTLIEGSVKILYKDEVVLLAPGQQFQPNVLKPKVVEADTEEVVAWKNGYFLFKNEDIRSIMRKLSRWYNVEVSYVGEIPEVGFGGNISTSKDITEVLDVLQLTNAVHFKVEGRRITVMR